jgi:uncharacterized protein YbaP (TraB family)
MLGVDLTGAHLRVEDSQVFYDRAAPILQSVGFLHPFNGFKPWRLALILGSTQIPGYGYRFEEGVDHALTARARRSGKEIAYLERASLLFELSDIHTREFADGLSFLRRTVEEIEVGTARQYVDHLISSYIAADVNALTAFKAMRTEQNPYLHSPLFVEREKVWIEAAKPILASDKPTLIVVGCLHLADPDSFLTLISSAGYQTQRAA